MASPRQTSRCLSLDDSRPREARLEPSEYLARASLARSAVAMLDHHFGLPEKARDSRKRALGTRTPMAIPQDADQRWSLDFTFANGVFCDTKECACHKNRYFDANGKRSATDVRTTTIMFGK